MMHDWDNLRFCCPRERITPILRTALENIRQQLHAGQVPSEKALDEVEDALKQYAQADESETRLRAYYAQTALGTEYIGFTFPENRELLMGCAVSNTSRACYTISGYLRPEDAEHCRKLMASLSAADEIEELVVLVCSHEEQAQWEKLCPKDKKIRFFVV